MSKQCKNKHFISLLLRIWVNCKLYNWSLQGQLTFNSLHPTFDTHFSQMSLGVHCTDLSLALQKNKPTCNQEISLFLLYFSWVLVVSPSTYSHHTNVSLVNPSTCWRIILSDSGECIPNCKVLSLHHVAIIV